uniref:Uncharacterized protein n=1 Tax=Spironucleus salmonicida TaxID=348837 RepID=V6LY22_9EUKA|eukprot:EST49465.1 Hypothetical protein SS50377_10214 [Spironucleus salmonicida]
MNWIIIKEPSVNSVIIEQQLQIPVHNNIDKLDDKHLLFLIDLSKLFTFEFIESLFMLCKNHSVLVSINQVNVYQHNNILLSEMIAIAQQKQVSFIALDSLYSNIGILLAEINFIQIDQQQSLIEQNDDLQSMLTTPKKFILKSHFIHYHHEIPLKINIEFNHFFNVFFNIFDDPRVIGNKLQNSLNLTFDQANSLTDKIQKLGQDCGYIQSKRKQLKSYDVKSKAIFHFGLKSLCIEIGEQDDVMSYYQEIIQYFNLSQLYDDIIKLQLGQIQNNPI